MTTIKNLHKFRGQMKWTIISIDGKVLISLPHQEEIRGIIKYDSDKHQGYYVEFPCGDNGLPFRMAGVDKRVFAENVLGYSNTGAWPWMKSTDDILKVLVELDKLYMFEEPDTEKPKSMEMEHPSIGDIDFTLKKKHYSLNFRI